MPDIRVDNLSFTYPGASSPALKKISLSVPQGEFLLLAGPSGCGKSTLALALAGLIPTRISGSLRGKIYFGDKDTRTLDIHEIAQSIGMVFQNPDEQLIHLDVEAEVAFGPENLALPRTEIAHRVEASLHYTGMDQFRKQEIFALSGGQKQRIAIAATLAMQSRVLVLDEPTSDLDPVGTQDVLRVLRTLNTQYHMTIVLVEHKIDEIIPWVDRVLLMDQGRIVIDKPPRQAFSESALWHNLGVAVPQMVQLAHALPDVFQGQTPLSVDETYEALHNTHYAQSLLQRNDILIPPQTPNFSTIPALSWERVDLTYDKKQVLKHITMHVMPQEWLAIVGANGSGKTSLASLAMGLQSPTSGVIRHHDKIVEAGQLSRQAQKIAYLFQAADNMLFTASVEEELLFGVKHQKKRQNTAAMHFTLEQLLEIVDLTSYRKSNPFHLSHGQRKRLALGALLTRYPEVLILDEPTTGQDEGHANAFLQFLQQLRELNKFTYMMITHHMDAVARYASRMLVIKDGQVFMDGPPEYVFAHVDALASAGILPMPIAQLHSRLCNDRAQRVSLNVKSFLQSLQPLEVLP